jgi:hypothetical protein
MATTPQSLHKPSDQGAAQNPNRRTLREISNDHFDTEQAATYLREKKNLDISAATLTMRRSFGKAPKFIKDGNFIRYNKNDLDEFARAVGLSTKAFDEPKREVMTDRERAQRRAGK